MGNKKYRGHKTRRNGEARSSKSITWNVFFKSLEVVTALAILDTGNFRNKEEISS